MVPYEMFCMMDSRLKQFRKNESPFGGINICVFRYLMQLPLVRGNQSSRFIPTTHLCRSFSLIESTENLRQQGTTTIKHRLNALQIGELHAEHFTILMNRLNKEPTGEFAINKTL